MGLWFWAKQESLLHRWMGRSRPHMVMDLAGGLRSAQGVFRDRTGQQIWESGDVSWRCWGLNLNHEGLLSLKTCIIKVIYVSYKKPQNKIKPSPSSLPSPGKPLITVSSVSFQIFYYVYIQHIWNTNKALRFFPSRLSNLYWLERFERFFMNICVCLWLGVTQY